ncbi:MAG: TetR/AcrR family transcriptional regulator [Bacteroidetes bacterium]|nr:TetR/AcrR family transcriptional regulator [Bacteroidota bacterium]
MANSPGIDQAKEKIILDAAQKRFGHFGLAKTTMTEIAADVGMSKASLYYYYPDKEHLFLAVIEQEMDEFIKALTAMIGEEEPASKKLKQYTSIRHEYFRRLISLAKLGEHTLSAMKASMDVFKQNLEKQEKELIRRIFQEGIKNGEFESFNAKAYADLFVATMQGLRVSVIHKKTLSETKEEDYQLAEQYQKQITAIFLKSISK